MNTRQRHGRIFAIVALFSLLLLSLGLALQPTQGARADSAANPNYTSYATTNAQALQSWYNTSNGLFNTTGWWNSANALDALIDYSHLTGSTAYTSDIATTFNLNSSNGFIVNPLYPTDPQYYDDQGWWGLTWVDAYDYTGNVTYLNMAKSIFANITKVWDTTCNGGVWWSGAKNYKNAITNELFLELAARLHERTAGDSGSGSYQDWANREWTWFSSSGLINSSNLINDGLNSSCQNNGETTWTYNQGVILGGLTDMYKITGNTSYLSQAEKIANAAITTLVNANGVLKEPNEPCGASCGADVTQFKGVFMRNLAYLYGSDQQTAYENFIITNANSIWQNDRNSAGQFGMMWYGPFDSADASRQSSALDALNAAVPFSNANGSAGTFSTGFETGQPQPTWTDTVDNAGQPAGGISNVGGICCGLTAPESIVRNETAHMGSAALMYSGEDNSTTSSHAYMQLFDLMGQNITVNPNTQLSYWIYPQSPATSGLVTGTNSSCVAIDLIFSDNTNLRDSGATDQNGNRVHPTYQCGKLKMDAWNLVTVNLGSFVNGKTIVRIDLGYDQPANMGGYRGYIDDLSIATGVVPTAGATYELVNRNSGKVLDVSGGSTANGGLIIQYTDHAGPNQQWKLANAGGGYFTLTNVSSGLALEVPGFSTSEGTQLDQWGSNGGTNQQWQLVSQGGGSYTLVNHNSGDLMDVNGASTADSATVIQWPADGGPNQQWQLVPVS